jgi:hypothetical protein
MDKKVVSPVCSGFGLGTSCVGCCHGVWEFTNYDALLELIQLPIFVKIKDDCRFISEPTKVVSMYFPMPPFTRISSYIERIERIEGNYQECLKKFEKIVQDNTQTLLECGGDKTLLRSKNLTSYVGLVDGKVGCLLYEKCQDALSLRPGVCQEYLCLIARQIDYPTVFNAGLKKFVQENSSSPNFNTFSFSRLIEILCYPVEIRLLTESHYGWEEDEKEVARVLNALFEIVTRG